ncbi:MAG TPA: SRPBCC family protein [Miltoncostaeaceae bacterium]|jgi:mxaD protein|nr:SRPBCC family protein [Miltoncostaeaceae bacterium]
MANSFEVSIQVAAPPEEVWALAGDPARIGEWFPPVVASEMDGDVRRATMGNGAVLVERITRRDDHARSYAYSVMEGIPGLTRHEAVISVEGAEAGSRVRWSQDAESEVEGYDAEARLRKVMQQGLESLRDMMEGVGD